MKSKILIILRKNQGILFLLVMLGCALLPYFCESLLDQSLIQTNLNELHSGFSTAFVNDYRIEASQTFGSQDIEMNQYDLGSFKTIEINLQKATMYNFTLKNTGSADFDIAVTNEFSIFNYVEQSSSTSYSDDVLINLGVPFWGNYDDWDQIEFTDEVEYGISVSDGNEKTFLLYLGSNYLEDSIEVVMYVILDDTINPYANTLSVEWNSLSLESPDLFINYSESSILYEETIPANDYSLVEFCTENCADLSSAVLDQTLSTEYNAKLIQWKTDLSGNTIRITDSISGNSNERFVPKFENTILDGTTFPGLIINSNSLSCDFNWTFTSIADETVTYEEITYGNHSIDFKISSDNLAWRIMELPETGFFDISFEDGENLQEYWDLAINFYVIGEDDGTTYSLNNFGENSSERAKIFCVSPNSEFDTVSSSFNKNILGERKIWIGGYGNINPEVTETSCTKYLGIKITATHSLAFSDLNCSIIVTENSISNHSQDEKLYIGSDNGENFNQFDLFQVREFQFDNFAQYKWGVQSENESSFETMSSLYCNDPTTETYVHSINNALFSKEIDTTGYTGEITLSFDLEVHMRNNADLYVYILNSSEQVELEQYTLISTSGYKEFTITDCSDINLQIIFNFTVGSTGGTDIGPIIDNINVSDSDTTYLFENFEGDFEEWQQTDNNGGSEKYWRIGRESQSVNNPEISIIYPNIIYSMQGYNAEPELSDFTKEFLNYNPYIQSDDTGYLIVTADTQINQNFSTIIKRTDYCSCNLENEMIICADTTYQNVIFQYGYYWEESAISDQFYKYYKLVLDGDHKYELKFISDDPDVIVYDATILNSLGIENSDVITGYYGFFMANTTYELESEETTVVYIKFDSIEVGAEITVEMSIKHKLADFPWFILATAVLAVSNVLSIVLFSRKLKKIQNIDENQGIRTEDDITEQILPPENKKITSSEIPPEITPEITPKKTPEISQKISENSLNEKSPSENAKQE